MKTKFVFVLLIVLTFTQAYSQSAQQRKIITASLSAQESSWNKGDLDGYMLYYWNSDSLKFIGKSGITYGWKTTLEHYKKTYPDKAAMGTPTFGELRMKKINCRIIMVTGSWKLDREKNNLSGYFSLLWRKIKGKWRIIADHTS